MRCQRNPIVSEIRYRPKFAANRSYRGILTELGTLTNLVSAETF